MGGHGSRRLKANILAGSGSLAGVDGCRGGWIAVIDEGERLNSRVFPDWSQPMTELERATLIGVDIPIGLPGKGSRACDLEARRRLGRPRGSSVFPAPVPGVAGQAQTLAPVAEFDAVGLRMEITV
jgi:predicted RNase H-like nuclease